MIIITGLGRCGTSFLAQFFHGLGFNLGNYNYYPELHAGFEDQETQRINVDMHNDYLVRGLVPNGEFQERIEALEADIVKDPRFTWHPDLIRHWREYTDIKVILCHRQFEEIIRSRQLKDDKVKNGFKDPKRGEDLDEFKKDFAEFVTMLYDEDIKFCMVYYPRFMRDYEDSYKRLSTVVEFDKEEGRKVWGELFVPEYVND